MCERCYGGDDLLEAAMSGILLPMCLPGSVTVPLTLTPPSHSPETLERLTPNDLGKRI